MIFLSAGHSNVPGVNYDPGAVGVNGRKEADETAKLRDAMCTKLPPGSFKTDMPRESLREYLARIRPGSGSIVCEPHFNAASGKASGIEVLVRAGASVLEKLCADELCKAGARLMKIKNRGVKTEAESQHGRLALMREQGIVVLIEVCFIDNPKDMAAYDKAFDELATEFAAILWKYEGMAT